MIIQFLSSNLAMKYCPLLNINANIVYNKLISLKTDNPDGWPILVLRETALQISIPLAIIFKNLSNKNYT